MGPWGGHHPIATIQDDAGDLNGMSQPTVSLVCKQGALALVAQRAQWIKMPQHDTEQNNIIAGFHSICGFRQVTGAIDCTHIESRKWAVTNATLEIMDIVAHWRGSTHDSRIFNERSLKQRFE
ncbi:Uncharacterized protein OBRU01_24074 [Operophtera brumata]|uniref:DDE Tnp4 domain-containing protein n=1 Tax=Operophtera brumata TaxID=104452 RepID=A0A0L7KNC8_OPEBR|nr:Uncharacterized protein OBRU01_24074 [Operophtera brumata]